MSETVIEASFSRSALVIRPMAVGEASDVAPVPIAVIKLSFVIVIILLETE